MPRPDRRYPPRSPRPTTAPRSACRCKTSTASALPPAPCCAGRWARTRNASELVAAMNRHDARRKIAHIHAFEAGGFEHRLERGLIGVLADRFGEVPVAVGVVGDQLAEQRQHTKRVKVVKRL